MIDSQIEILRTLSNLKSEMKVEIAGVQVKLEKCARNTLSNGPILDGVDAVVATLGVKIPFRTKDEFDDFNNKITADRKSFVKLVSFFLLTLYLILIFFKLFELYFCFRLTPWCPMWIQI